MFPNSVSMLSFCTNSLWRAYGSYIQISLIGRNNNAYANCKE